MFYEETEFQNSPIGKIPKEWALARLEEVAEVTTGGNAPQGEEYFKDGKYPFVRVQHFNGDKIYVDKYDLINEKATNEYRLQLFPKDSVIFPKSGASINLEKRAMLPFDAYVVNHLCVLIPKAAVMDNKFLYYLMKKRNLSKGSAGTTLPYLNLEHISKVSVPVPSLVEQHGIVGVLGVVDSAVGLVDEVIWKTERLKKGLMQQLLTRGIGHKEYKDTPIGRVPQDWQIVHVKDIAKSYKNGIYKPNEYYGKGYPCIRMYNIVEGHINSVNATLLDVTDQELEEYGLEPGDVMINRVNTPELVGKAGVVPEGFGKATFESKNIRVRFERSRILPEFFSVFVQTTAYATQVHARAKIAVAQATITQEDLDSLVVPLPSLPEQQKIAEVISTLDRKLALERKEKSRLERIKRGLMDLLLTGKVRVKVD